MKEYIVDLKIAKKLKGKGFPQTTYFRYEIDNLGNVEIETIEFSVHENTVEIYSAPLSDEFSKELPHEINGFHLLIAPVTNGYEIGYWEYSNEDEKRFEHFFDKKQSNALAKLWFYLKKEGYIK